MKKTILLSVFLFVSALAHAYDVQINGLYYNLDSDALTAEVSKYGPNDYKPSGNIVIPETIVVDNKTYQVTSIGEDAFSNCTYLYSVIIPNTVNHIGRNAFYQCI